jgi:DNA-binding HxlR family transcriptional regulator
VSDTAEYHFDMATRRTYGQGCGTAHALDLVGDRWALLVVRELVLGPKRFTDLRDGLPGIGPNVLSQRLKELEQQGILRRRVLPAPAGSTVYELTDWGHELDDIVIRLARWGARDPQMPREEETRPEWVVLGMRAVYAPDADPPPTVYELRFGDEVFWAKAGAGPLEVGHGAPADRDATLTAETETFARLIRGDLTPAAALRSGALELDGDRDALDRFPALFKFPPPQLAAG